MNFRNQKLNVLKYTCIIVLGFTKGQQQLPKHIHKFSMVLIWNYPRKLQCSTWDTVRNHMLRVILTAKAWKALTIQSSCVPCGFRHAIHNQVSAAPPQGGDLPPPAGGPGNELFLYWSVQMAAWSWPADLSAGPWESGAQKPDEAQGMSSMISHCWVRRKGQ